ncbi:MAG: phosphatase PAP2 family protein [Corynebacteriales bacterium]|uniref:Phosphatase PAP2 family protein n=1 Tax=Williamsia herbipolensis TaxID=1603258 RepID=A0AAU4JX23_9NOCA|nr:phosphatase PAP2 family protein [Williamsia herbipolensis]MCX6469110.1 phosphatase PAP2 family protein [Mycobacteriales bacterium]
MSSHKSDGQNSDRAVSGEDAILVGIQSALADRPGVLPIARGMSHVGEHALGWMAAAGIGVVVSELRGDEVAAARYAQAGVGAFGAHAASVIIKRIVRRPRPAHPRIAVGVSTPSRLSFPSSHATSTTAAAILLGRAAGLPPAALPAVLVAPMMLSRLVLGVHYPSDVAAGALVGAACAAATTRSDRLAARVTPRVWRALSSSRGPMRGMGVR